MSTRLALANLRHYKARTAVAIAGVAFAVLLIFMQLGFLGAVAKTATIVYDALEFDIMLRSPAYLHLTEPGSIPTHRLRHAESLSGVLEAKPLLVGLHEWQSPVSGEWRGIMGIGIEPLDAPFNREDLIHNCRLLTHPRSILIDRQTRADYGPANGWRFSDADIGVQTVLGQQVVEIVGHFSLGTGLAANGAVLQSQAGFRRSTPLTPLGHVSMGLITLRKGTSSGEVARALARYIESEGDTRVLTRAEVLQFELDRWVKNTSLGIIFQLGTLVALLVGIAIVYQVLSTDVTKMMPEYATLKAMGYRQRFLSAVVIQQAIAIAVVGFLPGLAFSLVGYRLTSAAANIPVIMNGSRIAGVFVLSILMCTLSGILSLLKLQQADPAELY